MFRFIIQKIINKKWLIFCLLIGSMLLIAISCCNPMYTSAALQKMLTDELDSQMNKTGTYPAIARLSGTINKNHFSDNKKMSSIFADPFSNAETLAGLYPIKPMHTVTSFESNEINGSLSVNRAGVSSFKFKVNALSSMKEHINIMYGEYCSDKPVDGVYECIISERIVTNLKLVTGDEINSGFIVNGEPVVFRISGIFRTAESEDTYWIKDPLDYENSLFMDMELYKQLFVNGNKMQENIKAKYYCVFDYQKIKTDMINDFIIADNKIRYDSNEYNVFEGSFNYEDSFKTYRKGSNKVTVTMWIFQTPVLILLCVFIFMVSNQIINIEQSEIAMLKSRGVSKGQLILSYLFQSFLISFAALLIGYPLGFVFCKLFGSTRSFLEFSILTTIDVHFTFKALLYAIFASIVSVLIMTVPVLKYANFSIVEQKVNKKKKKTPLWQKMGLDIILLVISVYGLYSSNKNKATIIKEIQEGGSLDPVIYFSSTVFLLAFALLLLRILPLLSGISYRFICKKCKPSTFAGFLQINKNIKNQSFIIVFLVLTLALGIFNATAARSITSNEEIRNKYRVGTTFVMTEKWEDNSAAIRQGYAEKLEYIEPSFSKYTELKGKTEMLTRVLRDEHAGMGVGTDVLEDSATFMGLITDEFGKTAYLPEDSTKFHINYYLNALAKNPNGVIISRNFAQQKNVGVGDKVSIYRKDKLLNPLPTLLVEVVAIVDAWPTYESKIYKKGSNGEISVVDNYLCVVNFNSAYSLFDIEPYEIWVKTNNTAGIYDFISDKKIKASEIDDTVIQAEEIKEDPFFQVTSGMLTITFIIVLILSIIGFMIYWITSIKSRELIFGIYRAMGLSMREIANMLLIEHTFGSVLPILFGIFTGVFSARLFVPLILLAYSPSYSTLKTVIITSGLDMIRIGLCVIVMLILCFMVIRHILSTMKIAQALKLGED